MKRYVSTHIPYTKSSLLFEKIINPSFHEIKLVVFSIFRRVRFIDTHSTGLYLNHEGPRRKKSDWGTVEIGGKTLLYTSSQFLNPSLPRVRQTFKERGSHWEVKGRRGESEEFEGRRRLRYHLLLEVIPCVGRVSRPTVTRQNIVVQREMTD